MLHFTEIYTKARLGKDGKSWLKKGVSELQGQATAWVSSWRQDTCVAWHFNPF